MKLSCAWMATCALAVVSPALAHAASELPGTTLSSISNPAIGAIGWVQAASGSDRDAQERAFELKEIELSLQSAVDPFSRAEFFLAFSEEGLEVEEGYITWLALPGGGQAKLGKFRADLGKFNRTHPPETPFADRPLSTEAFLGPEGLATTGVSLSALLPNPFDLYWDLTANLGVAPTGATHAEAGTESGELRHGEGSPIFGGKSREDLLHLGRSSLFIPLSEGADLNLGFSYANARSNSELLNEGNRAQVATGDLTFRWKNPRRAIYRSLLVQTEWSLQQGSAGGAKRRSGGFAYAVYQFARQWRTGLRYDWSELPGTELHVSGALALLSYQPSEFSTLSIQARRVTHTDGEQRDAAFFKWTFNIGPHGAHPY